MRELGRRRGFTLIELSIVLLIIGLVVGGVLVGQNLIRAAGVRAQITQIENYNRAANTFRGKFGQLPGDMDAVTAARFGFAPRGLYAGEGDGNGVIEGVGVNAPNNNYGASLSTGEIPMFWEDLSAAGLIEGVFNTASPSVPPGAFITGTNIASYLPAAKIGAGNYIYIWSFAGLNYFGLGSVFQISNLHGFNALYDLPVGVAYSMDAKIDDGLPQSGNVQAQGVTYYNTCCTGIGPYTISWAPFGLGASPGTAATPSATTCYDNGGNASVAMSYSLEVNSGNGPNCALSFRFQ